MTNTGEILASVAALVVALFIGFQPTGAAAQRGGGSRPPPTLETAAVLCAQTGNNVLRYSPDGNCPTYHQEVALADGPVTICVSTLTGVMRLAGNGSAGCQTRELSVIVPGEGASYACANPYTNVLAYAEDPADCQPGYTIVQFLSAPVAVADTYTDADGAAGNTLLTVDAADGVLANDTSGGATLTIINYDATSANGGDVTINADGSFTYNPPAGFEGDDTFNYTVEDTIGQQTTAEVTVEVTGMIWYVDNSQATNGDGRLTSPFNTLAGLNNDGLDPDDEDDYIFLFEGNVPYTGIALEDGQNLVGQGVDLVFLANTLVPASNPPTIQDDPAIVLAEGNEISGLIAASTTSPSTVSGANLDEPPTISDVTFHPPTNGGFALYLANMSGSGELQNVTFEGTSAGTGMRLYNDGDLSSEIYMNNATFAGLASGLEAITAEGAPSSIYLEVTNSQFTDISGRGVFVRGDGVGGVTELVVFESSFNNTALASDDRSAVRVVTAEASSQEVLLTVVANTFTGVPVTNSDGRATVDVAIHGSSEAGITVRGNTITGGSSSGVSVQGVSGPDGGPVLDVEIVENTINVDDIGVFVRSHSEVEGYPVEMDALIAGNFEISGEEYAIHAIASGEASDISVMSLNITSNSAINGEVRVRGRDDQLIEAGFFGNTIVSTRDAINIRSLDSSGICSTMLDNTLTSGGGYADIWLRESGPASMEIFHLASLSVDNNGASVDVDAGTGTTSTPCGGGVG